MPAAGIALPAFPTGVLAAAAGDARAFLRLADADAGGEADALLERLAAAALAAAEGFIGAALVARQFEDVVAGDGRWTRLCAHPVTAVLGAVALPPGAAPAMLPVDAWAADIDARAVARVRVTGGTPAAVTYLAGLAADWTEMPAPVAQGVLALIGALRADPAAGLPPGVAALWRPLRRLRVMAVTEGRP